MDFLKNESSKNPTFALKIRLATHTVTGMVLN